MALYLAFEHTRAVVFLPQPRNFKSRSSLSLVRPRSSVSSKRTTERTLSCFPSRCSVLVLYETSTVRFAGGPVHLSDTISHHQLLSVGFSVIGVVAAQIKKDGSR